jgi:hypothetical protein
MSIDVHKERLYGLRDACQFVPLDPQGRACHPDRLRRAVKRKDLEVVRYGKYLYTSKEAIERWAGAASALGRTLAQRERAVAGALRDIERMGLHVKSARGGDHQ